MSDAETSLRSLPSSWQAIKQQADCIECDVILTKDAVAICRHDLTLESTTDVANRTEFAHMRTTRMVEGEEVTGWFAVDFTVAQIKTLRAKQVRRFLLLLFWKDGFGWLTNVAPLPAPARQRMDFRDPNYNGLFEVATLQEQIDLVKAGKGDGDDVVEEESERVRWHLRLLDWFLGARGGGSDLGKAGAIEKGTTCLYPEMKSTAWHNSLGLWGGRRSEDIILEVLRKNGYSSKDDDIYLQSFETEDLLHVHSRSSIKLIQLIGAPDVIQWDTKRPYSELLSEKGMHEIAGYAFAVSPSKNDICPKNETTGYIDEASIQKGKAFIDMVHSKGLQAHPWVLRDENRYLAWNYGQDAYNEYTLFIKEVGVDGFFTDFPQTASNYIRLFEMDLRQQTRLP